MPARCGLRAGRVHSRSDSGPLPPLGPAQIAQRGLLLECSALFAPRFGCPALTSELFASPLPGGKEVRFGPDRDQFLSKLGVLCAVVGFGRLDLTISKMVSVTAGSALHFTPTAPPRPRPKSKVGLRSRGCTFALGKQARLRQAAPLRATHRIHLRLKTLYSSFISIPVITVS